MASFSREIILTSSPDQPIAAYEPLTGATLAEFSGSRSPRRGLALAGPTLIAASHISATASSGFVRLYNWWSSAAFLCIPVPEPIAPIVSTLDGSYLFSGGLSGQVHVHSLPSGNLRRSFRAHRQPVSCLTINEDGSLLISGGDDGTIAVFPILRLLDASDDEEDDSARLVLYQFTAHSLSVTSIALGPGGCNSTIASSSLDGTCKFWSLAGGAHLRTVEFPCAMWCITVDPTNSEAHAGGSDGRVHVIPLKVRERRVGADGEEVAAWGAEQSGAVVAVAMVNGNRNLVSASEDGIIRVWDVENGSIVRVFGHEKGSVSDLIVAKGVVGVGGGRIRDGVGHNGERNSGFWGREICRNVREVGEMEEWLRVAVKDRRRAIDMLETATGTYERLLGLLLKEAKGGGGGGGDSKEEESKDLETSL